MEFFTIGSVHDMMHDIDALDKHRHHVIVIVNPPGFGGNHEKFINCSISNQDAHHMGDTEKSLC